MRAADPQDRRQIVVSVPGSAGRDLVDAEQRASQEWLQRRLGELDGDQRDTLLRAAGLISALIDESA